MKNKKNYQILLSRALLCESTGKAYSTTPGVSVGGIISKTLNFYFEFLCDGQGIGRQAIVYMDRSCCLSSQRGGSTLKGKNLLPMSRPHFARAMLSIEANRTSENLFPFNPIALRMAKTPWSFGGYECSSVKKMAERHRSCSIHTEINTVQSSTTTTHGIA